MFINKGIHFASLGVIGSILGALIGYIWFSEKNIELEGIYSSETSFITVAHTNFVIHEKPHITLKLNGHDQYHLFVTLSKGLGFISSGNFEYNEKKLTLNSIHYEKIVPDRPLTFLEKMLISQGTLILGGDIDLVIIDKDRFLLIKPYHISYFCSKQRC
ncbi:hypothetical protein L1D15_00025 [Vibrio sp. Isolate25]|uniref:hypothetical protein n=1 Tax=Vibrio sp. Isolate25 TaxID=2908535 RepID=UPI001EFDF3D9|nr:hypothetical protein [Vibrio sp. Isolate25]MCG9595103.1 hypothetical protein [Vibrio sp. Isolate25]